MSNSISSEGFIASDKDVDFIINNLMFPKYDDLKWDSPEDTEYKGGVLTHNTSFVNIPLILERGLISDAPEQYHSNGFIWGVNLSINFKKHGKIKAPKGYGGTTIAFYPIDGDAVEKLNDDQFGICSNVPVKNFISIDPIICDEWHLSDMIELMNKYGVDKVYDVVLKHHDNFFTDEQIKKFLDWCQENKD